jgi:hypothetical protein
VQKFTAGGGQALSFWLPRGHTPSAQKKLQPAYFSFRKGRSGNFLFNPRACLTTTLALEMIPLMSPSPNLRDLIHENDETQPLQRLQGLIEAGLASGPAEARSADELDELRAIARGEQH